MKIIINNYKILCKQQKRLFTKKQNSEWHQQHWMQEDKKIIIAKYWRGIIWSWKLLYIKIILRTVAFAHDRITDAELALTPYTRNLGKNMNQLFSDSVGEWSTRERKQMSWALWSPWLSASKHFPGWRTRSGTQKSHSSLTDLWGKMGVRLRWLEAVGHGTEEKRNLQTETHTNLYRVPWVFTEC